VTKPLRVLGIDTSLRSTGVGVIEAEGSHIRAREYGTIKNKPALSHSACLRRIHEGICEIVEKESPTAVAIEGIFHFKNIKTAVTLGQARGVVIAVCALADLPVYEYAPRRVKQAVVGYGNAHKSQVGQMIKKLLNLDEVPPEDPADALAIAICHLHCAKGVTAEGQRL